MLSGYSYREKTTLACVAINDSNHINIKILNIRGVGGGGGGGLRHFYKSSFSTTRDKGGLSPSQTPLVSGRAERRLMYLQVTNYSTIGLLR